MNLHVFFSHHFFVCVCQNHQTHHLNPPCALYTQLHHDHCSHHHSLNRKSKIIHNFIRISNFYRNSFWANYASNLIRLTSSFFNFGNFWGTANITIFSSLPIHIAASATNPIISTKIPLMTNQFDVLFRILWLCHCIRITKKHLLEKTA